MLFWQHDMPGKNAATGAAGRFNKYDTTVSWSGEAYKLSISIRPVSGFDQDSKNGLFTIIRIRDHHKMISDSIGCMIPSFDFRDYNGDGVKDILVYHFHGARANTAYHLYLADTKNKTFKKVIGFEQLPNTQIDSNKIITSCALYGRIGYSFYVITKDLRVKKLGKTVETAPNEDSGALTREYKRVVKLVGDQHE